MYFYYAKERLVIMDIRLRDILVLKKKHPCGSSRWLVLRVGMDFRLKCEGCGHETMSARSKIEKSIRSVERNGEKVEV